MKPIKVRGLTFKQFDYHRNGVGGTGFFCAVAHDPKEGKADMLITYFDIEGECACAVYSLELLPSIKFGHNSWRGDHYVDAMRDMVAMWREGKLDPDPIRAE